MQKYPEISILWYPLRFCHTHFSYHFHVIDKRIAMLPSFSTSAINTRRFNFLTSIQIRQCFSKHLNCIVHKGSLSLKKKRKNNIIENDKYIIFGCYRLYNKLGGQYGFLYLFFRHRLISQSPLSNLAAFEIRLFSPIIRLATKNYVGRWILRGTYINNMTVRV